MRMMGSLFSRPELNSLGPASRRNLILQTGRLWLSRTSGLFTASELPAPLPDVIERWRQLDSSDNPFPELYRLASAPDLPERARFLYLVQALEGLHGFEHNADDRREVWFLRGSSIVWIEG
jgi:hypothetical protein